ncbi:DUF3899 domain-containing protein [Fictibacillus sp. Mic-4]|uniref:DUF3899 domain-containing protein n=1 Tax=Fictibacillus sp. Mic-4 TaxID=3132826 RepID=UPI003CECCB5C
MKRYRTTFYLVIITILLSVIFNFIFFHSLSLLALVNTLFYLSLALFLFGLLLYVLKGGFFDAIVLSFRRFIKKSGKTRMEDFDEHHSDSNFLLSERISNRLTRPVLGAGFFLVFVTTVIAFLL